MNDPDVSPYLPYIEQGFNKLPEREFFVAVLGTVKPDCFKIINERSDHKRSNGMEEKSKAYVIILTDSWLHKLNNFPFI
jgi:hypothetical protein